MTQKEKDRDERLFLAGMALQGLLAVGVPTASAIEESVKAGDEAWRTFKKHEDRMAALEIAAMASTTS